MSIESRLIASELSKCEAVIERHLTSRLDAGVAMLRIRDEKLYREKYETWDAYCSQRWGLERSYCHRLIEAANVRAALCDKVDESELPKTESQLREVAKAPPELQPEVVAKANKAAWAEDRMPTASDYRAAVAEIVYEDVAEPETESPKKLTQADIAVGNATIGLKIVAAIDQVKRLLRAVTEQPGTELLIAREKSIMRQLDSARSAVSVTIPDSVCQRCNGKCCEQCGNLGWVNSVMAREMKK